MSFATSSTSAVRAALRSRTCFTTARTFATATDLPSSTLTGAQASAYLSRVLSLPESAAFPPDLALQILTHKSYRFVHRIAHPPPYTAAEIAQGQVSHNGRLSFVGRRAIAAYLAMFLHEASAGSAERIRALDFVRDSDTDIEGKMDNLRHVNNLGRTVGQKWNVGSVMRFDRQETGRENDYARIKGLTVEAILGGVFLQHGSPAAQRTFHAHILPAISAQLRDPELRALAGKAKHDARTVGTVAQ